MELILTTKMDWSNYAAKIVDSSKPNRLLTFAELIIKKDLFLCVFNPAVVNVFPLILQPLLNTAVSNNRCNSVLTLYLQHCLIKVEIEHTLKFLLRQITFNHLKLTIEDGMHKGKNLLWIYLYYSQFGKVYEKFYNDFSLKDFIEPSLNGVNILWLLASHSAYKDEAFRNQLVQIYTRFRSEISLQDLLAGSDKTSLIWNIVNAICQKNLLIFLLEKIFNDHPALLSNDELDRLGPENRSIRHMLVNDGYEYLLNPSFPKTTQTLSTTKFIVDLRLEAGQQINEIVSAEQAEKELVKKWDDLIKINYEEEPLINEIEPIPNDEEQLLEIEKELFEDPLVVIKDNASENFLIQTEPALTLSTVLSDEKSANPLLNNQAMPRGGIANKYLGIKKYQLPEPIKSLIPPPTFARQCDLVSLNSLSKNSNNPSLQKLSISNENFQCDYYTAQTMLTEIDHLFFICAGRKEKALIPTPQTSRSVLVVTQEEFKQLQQWSTHVDFLVIKNLTSSTHGKYQNLALITSRRLAILLFAHHQNLKNIIMMDDNISQIKFEDDIVEGNAYDRLFAQMKESSNGHGCSSIKTQSPKKPRPGELGSKMFMLNMRNIKEILPQSDDIYLLFPDAAQADFCGEDYIMQIMLHCHPTKKLTYQILNPRQFTLIRARKHLNAFLKIGQLAKPLELLHARELQKLSASYQEWLKAGITTFNEIVLNNYATAQTHQAYIQNADLFALHAQANGLPVKALSPVTLAAEDINFSVKFNTLIAELAPNPDFFRAFQYAALKSLLKQKECFARFNIATGCGKTLLQVMMACMGYHAAQEDEFIVILTPQITLVNQFYANVQKIISDINQYYPHLAIDPQRVLKISSDDFSIPIQTWLKNNKNKQKSILIFCSDSFNKFLNEYKEGLASIPLILADEYHECVRLINKIKATLSMDSECRLVGSTATSPKNDPFNELLFNYSILDGIADKILVPVMADTLGNYSINKVAKLIGCLPSMVKHLQVPGFANYDTFKSCRGIIFFSSIEQCEKAQANCRAQGIRSYSIHSSNPKHKADLKKFLANNEPGLLIACDMLGIGFDDTELTYAIIARDVNINDKASKNNIIQKLGRIMRAPKNRADQKIGYVLGFDNVISNVVLPLINQFIDLPLSTDYIMQKLGFKFNNNVCEVVKLHDLDDNLIKNSAADLDFLIERPSFQFQHLPDTRISNNFAMEDDSVELNLELIKPVQQMAALTKLNLNKDDKNIADSIFTFENVSAVQTLLSIHLQHRNGLKTNQSNHVKLQPPVSQLSKGKVSKFTE